MFVYDLAVPPLPFAPRPFPDELLLSWTCRLAAANHVRLSSLFPELPAMSRYRLNCDPGQEIIARMAAMSRLPQSALQSLLLPNQFPNLPLLTFLEIPKSPAALGDENSSEYFPPPLCIDCAAEEEPCHRGLYWQAEAGLLTTLLCPRHGTQVGYACPGCHRGQLTVIWNDACLIVRCLRCAWRPPPPPNSKLGSTNHLGPLQLIFRLQRDIAAALRDLAPSHFWCGPITAVHFLRVVDDLYWLLRTPGLSARAGKKFTFTQDFTWTSFYREPRTLFTRTQYWSFCAWDSYSRAEVLVAIAAAMLGTRAFITLGRRPYYLKPTANYPWDWILPQLREASAQEFIRRVAEWPLAMRMPVTIATGELS